MDHAPDPHPDLLRCKGCGHRFYRGAETVDSTALYGHNYHDNEEYLDYAGQRETLARNFRDYLDRMERHGAGGGSLLEVGCAHGFFLAEAAARFPRVHGLDVSASAVTAARERLGVSAEAADVCTHRPSAPYDVVCLWDTIEHLQHPDRYVGKVAAEMAPGGVIAVTTGDISSRVARWRGAKWRQIHPPTHLHYFSRQSLTRLLERCGFAVSYIGYDGGYRSVDMMAYILLAIKRDRADLYRMLKRTGLLDWTLYLNLYDIMYIVAKRR